MSVNLTEYFNYMVKYRRICKTEEERKTFALRIFTDMIRDERVEPAIKKRLSPIVNQHLASGMQGGL